MESARGMVTAATKERACNVSVAKRNCNGRPTLGKLWTARSEGRALIGKRILEEGRRTKSKLVPSLAEGIQSKSRLIH